MIFDVHSFCHGFDVLFDVLGTVEAQVYVNGQLWWGLGTRWDREPVKLGDVAEGSCLRTRVKLRAGIKVFAPPACAKNSKEMLTARCYISVVVLGAACQRTVIIAHMSTVTPRQLG